MVAALLGGDDPIVHAQLIAVVQEGSAGHREDPRKGQPPFRVCQPRGGTGGIVIAGNEAPEAVVAAVVILGQVVRKEPAHVGAGIPGEEAGIADVAAAAVPEGVVPHHGAVAVAVPVEIKVHVKAAAQSLVRMIPLGNEGSIRIFLVNGAQNVPPDLHGGKLFRAVILHERLRHIHPEAVAAQIQPEPDHILHGLPGRKGVRTGDALLPAFPAFPVAVVQGGLTFEEVDDIGGAARVFAADEGHTVAPGKGMIRPDVPAGIFVWLGLAALAEPFVFFTGVAGNQIQQNPDPQRVGAAAQLSHILVGAVAGRNLLIVPDVVARILEGRVKAGIDPQGVAAETLHVGQLFGDAGKVADAVSVGVPEALRIYFIKYGVTKPGCRHNNSSVFCFCMDHPTNTGNCRDRGGWRGTGRLRMVSCGNTADFRRG